MAFDFEAWQRAVWENLKGWKTRLIPGIVNAGYVGVAAGALWPLVLEAQTGDPTRVIMVLMSLTAGLSTNLLSEQILRWKDEANGEPDVAVWIRDRLEQDAALRLELERVVEKLKVLELAKSVLPESDQGWFESTLQRELAALGSLPRLEATVTGNDNVVAVGEGATASITIHEVHYHNAHEPPAKGTKTRISLLREAYLNRLFEQCNGLDIDDIDRQTAGTRVSLHAVYTTLYTGPLGHHSSALDELNQHKYLVLLGDPGSGKSTFVNYVAMCLCGEELGRSEANLQTLNGTSFAKPNGDDPYRRERSDYRPRWEHGALLPVRVILRDFAARGLLEASAHASTDHLWKFVVGELGETLADLAEPLKQELLDRGGLIMLDGLDEVPQAARRRVQLRQAVESFAATFNKCRIVVTGRTYAYQHQDWRLSNFETLVLAPFNSEQIESFIDHWYTYIAVVRDLKDGSARAEDLKAAISRNARLAEFAERPLLLTLMASLHSWRNGPLPENREELYNDAVDLLLDLWERPKRVNGERLPGLAELLNTDKARLRQTLNELAFQAHRTQTELTGTADVDETSLVSGLLGLCKEKQLNPIELVDYLSQRAGLLLPRGERVYTFPHRTFQEYLAACYLTDHDYPDRLGGLVFEEFERWREVALLAGARATRSMGSSAVWTLAETLCASEPETSPSATDLWNAYLAGQVLAETARLDHVSKRDQPKLERVRRWLVRALGDPALPAIERARAGDALARLGEPRLEVVTVEGMQFCFVPAGDFMMGEGDGMHRNRALDYGYWMARHPVSVAQWKQFVESTGLTPMIPESLQDPANRPVRWVSWEETQAFCAWLNERFFTSLPAGLRFQLPSEAEWEKAARGGLTIPASDADLVRALGSGFPPHVVVDLWNNPNAERVLPWIPLSDSAKYSEHANTVDSMIGATSALGCFQLGASPYGCFDLMGNVFEWTRSLLRRYPYEPGDGREDLASREVRVVRGGVWYGPKDLACCVSRMGFSSYRGYDYLGFRVVASPTSFRI